MQHKHSNSAGKSKARAGALRSNGLYASLCLVSFALLLYGDLLFMRTGTIVSHVVGDACGAFLPWRRFGFGELLKGHLPLWNPYVFCGAPFVGNIQSAMFYPVNAILHSTLSTAKAVNAEVIFHTLVAGFSMMAWIRNRGTGWLASVLAAAIVMAGAPYCLRVNLGQLNVIAVFSWLPLTLLVVDKLTFRVTAGWIFTGILVVSMQLLAGYPPSVFCNACAVVLYSGLCLVHSQKKVRTVGALSLVAGVPLVIAAAPLAAGVHTTGESLRSLGTSIEFASSWSFPYENFLTALMPAFFGDYVHVTYWGRWCLWDVCIFIGIGSLFMLFYGAIYAPQSARKYSAVLLLVLILTALGRYTPFFSVLYYLVPGFSSFRAPSKFLLPALVFAAMLAGLGADEFMRSDRRSPRFVAAAWSLGAILLLLAFVLQSFPSLTDEPSGLWRLLIAGMEESGEAYYWESITSTTVYESAWVACISGFIASLTCVLVGYSFLRAPGSPKFRIGLVCFCILELILFSRYSRVIVNTETLVSEELVTLRATDPGDYRTMQAKGSNQQWRGNYPMDINMMAPWGYDPVMLDRYVTFFTFALGGPLHQQDLKYEAAITNIIDPLPTALAKRYFRFKFKTGSVRNGSYPEVEVPELFRLMRVKYVYFWPEAMASPLGGVEGVYQVRDPYPHFSIYRDYRVVPDSKEVLLHMTGETVDLRRTLFLESEPAIKPGATDSSSASDLVTLEEWSTDSVTLDVHLETPGVLLITDAYSKGWQAHALTGSSQEHYEIQPADYAFQAIPLAGGHHRIRLEYAPQIILAGKWITGVSSACYLAMCCVWALFRGRRRMSLSAENEPDETDVAN